MRREHLMPLLAQINFDIDRETSKGWIIGHCPFAPYHPAHKSGRDNSASFCVKANDEGRSGFNCFTCKMSGNVMEMFGYLGHYTKQVAKYQKLTMEANLKEYFMGSDRPFDEAPKDIIKPKPLSEKMFHNMFPPAWQSLTARTYLKRRGIGEQTCEMLGILYDPKEKRIVFPVRDRENRLYGFTGRTILKDEEWKKLIGYGKVKDYGFDDGAEGKKQFFLLGAHLVDLSKPILLVEGLFALAHMIEIGADSIVQPVASMGSALSHYQAGILEDWGKSVYLLYDRDPAGRAGMFGYNKPPKPGQTEGDFVPGAMQKLWELVPTYRCLWPKDFYDPDDLSIEQVKLMVKTAKPVTF